MNNGFYIRKVAVLGAGVMGAQIAAHLANAGVEVMLFELAVDGDDPNANASKAIANLAKLEPSPLATKDSAKRIIPANYDQHLQQLGRCDLLIEAIAERMDWKQGLYARITPYFNKHAIITSNTSGLGIDLLAKALPEGVRPRFCGMHFFNPPRYMRLVELVPGTATDSRVLDRLETFLVTTLGKGVIRAKDTPNFIANRIGVFSMVAVMRHTERLGLSLDLVDALTGPAIGRPKSATYRTADVVGLDTLAHVVDGSAQVLENDPWKDYLKLPPWLHALIEKGALGQKTRAGIYRKQGREIQVLNPVTGQYQPAGIRPDPDLQTILKLKNPATQLAALRENQHPQSQFLWAILRDVFHYSAYWLGEIADNARDLDLAIRWGFGWERGPLETWQSAGWKQVAQWISEDIQAGKTMAAVELPAWVSQVQAAHTPKGSYSPTRKAYRPPSQLPIYRRQLLPESVLGEAPPDAGNTVFETDAVRLWHGGDDIAVLTFKTKMHTIGEAVLDGTLEALRTAEKQFQALVLWHSQPPFSAGADLNQVATLLQDGGDTEVVSKAIIKFQHTTNTLRYASIPIVAAIQGLTLGGGCEFLLHCDRVVATLESYVGLVEAGIGVLPAGGGCKALIQRAEDQASGGDLFPFIRRYFETIAMAKVAKSAEEARQLGLLSRNDCVIFNPQELLYVAKTQARALAETGYRPPLKQRIRVVGRNGVASLRLMAVNMLEGGFISPHDYLIAGKIAEVLCGGDVDPDTVVDEDWLLDLERMAFLDLIHTEKTQARVRHMLETGKPLRN